MNDTGTEGQTLSKLVSGPGIVVLAVLGVAVLAAARLFGSDTILREVVTEVIAGFGNAILILALFELFFRAGIERLIKRATGSDATHRAPDRCGRRCRTSDRESKKRRAPRTKRGWMVSRRSSHPSSTETSQN